MNEVQTRLFPDYSGKMRQRNLREGMVTLHCTQKSHSITFNKFLSAEILDRELLYACVCRSNDCITVTFYRHDGEMKVTTNTNATNVIINSVEATVEICRYFSLEDGDYYIGIEVLEHFADRITYILTGIIDGQWYTPSPSQDVEQQENAGTDNAACCATSASTTALPALTLDTATDEQLYDELRRRGYEGTLTKQTTLG